MIGIITGSGLYDLDIKDAQTKIIETKFGAAKIKKGAILEADAAFIARHGNNHSILANMINHRANLTALKQLNAKAIIATTVCGSLKNDIPLGKLIIFDDLFYPDNRLPSGELCSIFSEKGDKKRGHYIFENPFSNTLRKMAIDAFNDFDPVTKGTYCHANGPRFNSKSEINFFKRYADCISQTAGPEIVLAGELEIPYLLLGYTVDYANGISNPTPIEVLNKNLVQSKTIFANMITKLIGKINDVDFENFVYRFENE